MSIDKASAREFYTSATVFLLIALLAIVRVGQAGDEPRSPHDALCLLQPSGERIPLGYQLCAQDRNSASRSNVINTL